jgi:colicin import membrane protein
MRRTSIHLVLFSALAALVALAFVPVAGAEEAAGGMADSLKRAAGTGVGTAADEAARGSTMGTAATKGSAAAAKDAAGDLTGAGQAEEGLAGTVKSAAGVGIGTAADEAGGGSTMGAAASKGSSAAVNSALGVPAQVPAVAVPEARAD